MNKAIFIDKDGTLIKDVPYNVDPSLIRFEDYAFESMKSLQLKGYLVFIISNQPGIGLGRFEEKDLEVVKEKIARSFSENELILDGFYYCPHRPNEGCNCRKPKPGLILKAAEENNIELSQSWMIGDILNDVEAGTSAGCKTVLIDNGNETEWIWSRNRIPDLIARNLKDAAEYILDLKEIDRERLEKL